MRIGPEVLSAILLVAVLAFAIVRPRGLPEAVIAAPAAITVVAGGALSWADAWAECARLFPVVAFLAAVLVISDLAARDGLFEWAGDQMGRRSDGSPQRLLVLVFAVAAATTAVLSLDATVVLLTPVVFATASRVGVRARPHVYACTHLANASSVLLPASNLTNLLAVGLLGLSFLHFGALMVLPWAAILVVEYVGFRWFFAGDLSVGSGAPPSAERVELPVFTAVVLGLTLVGFVVTSLFGIDVAWAAAVGAFALAVRALVRRQARPRELLVAANPLFLVFVLALAVVVRAVVDNGLADGLARIVPAGDALPALLAWAGLAALAANVVNNLPAALMLLPLAAPAGPAAGLAVLIGVNVGPNLTYVGSLATLLWRRIVHAHDHEAPLGEFTWLGVLTTPVAIVAGVLGLWASWNLLGGAR